MRWTSSLQLWTLGYTDTVLLNAFCVNRVSDVHVQKRSKNPSMVNKLLKCLCSVCVLCFELLVAGSMDGRTKSYYHWRSISRQHRQCQLWFPGCLPSSAAQVINNLAIIRSGSVARNTLHSRNVPPGVRRLCKSKYFAKGINIFNSQGCRLHWHWWGWWHQWWQQMLGPGWRGGACWGWGCWGCPPSPPPASGWSSDCSSCRDSDSCSSCRDCSRCSCCWGAGGQLWVTMKTEDPPTLQVTVFYHLALKPHY